MGNKDSTCKVTGAISGAIAVAGGAALCVATGGTALLAGGVAFSAGISGTVNSFQQANNNEEEFKAGSFIANVTIGVGTGVLTAGAGAAASSITSKFALEGGKKLAAQAGMNAVSGALQSAGGTMANQLVDTGEIDEKQIIKSLFVGLVAGGAGSGVGGSTNSFLANKISSNTGKVIIGITAGSAGGAALGGGVQILSNIYEKEKAWDDGIQQAMCQGAIIGAVSGGINAARDVKLRTEKAAKNAAKLKSASSKNIQKQKFRPNNQKAQKNNQQTAQLDVQPKSEVNAQTELRNHKIQQQRLYHSDAQMENIVVNCEAKQVQYNDTGNTRQIGESTYARTEKLNMKNIQVTVVDSATEQLGAKTIKNFKQSNSISQQAKIEMKTYKISRNTFDLGERNNIGTLSPI